MLHGIRSQIPQASLLIFFFVRRFRRLIVRTVECNLLSLFAQAFAIGLVNHGSIGFYFVMADMMLAKFYTFSLLVSLNIRHSENDHGTSEGGFFSFRGRGGVDSTALSDLHSTVGFPSTQVTVDIQQETTPNWYKKGPAFNADVLSELEINIGLSPVR